MLKKLKDKEHQIEKTGYPPRTILFLFSDSGEAIKRIRDIKRKRWISWLKTRWETKNLMKMSLST
jgi:hypothetical protein